MLDEEKIKNKVNECKNVINNANRGIKHSYASQYNNLRLPKSEDAPFASIQKAKEYVRTIKKFDGDIIVELADGFYPLSETVVFDENDSGNKDSRVIYRAANGAKPILSGGKLFSGKWEAADEVNWLPDGLVAYKVPLDRDAKLRAIYVNGERAAMTRRTATPL